MKTRAKYLGLGLIIMSILFSNINLAIGSGLLPITTDGFEEGDWRNFRPHYIGDATDWIRPRFVISDSDPINGNYSLRWQSDDRDHQWLMLSNAFYLRRPVTVSVDFRVKGQSSDYSAGLILMESHDDYAGIKVSKDSAGLFIKGTATQPKANQSLRITPGDIYQLTVTVSDKHSLQARIIEKQSGKVLAEFETFTAIEPIALAMYVKTAANDDTIIDFDDIAVDAASYRIPSGQWVRSPQYVVLPRLPDVAQDQGNWVGGQSTMKKDGQYLMWYRVRDNQERGRGYGFATSSDGLNWEKYDDNPVFKASEEYSSNEKIHVLHVDGIYRAWFAVDTPKGWVTAYATSEDGIDWKQHGLVIDETYCKDVVVIYLDGTYYLYSIKDNDKIGIYTSDNGVDFTHRNTIEMGIHAHIAAFYEKNTGRFHLFSTGGFNGVLHAVSSNGIDFKPFKKVWDTPAVGLDDWVDAGVTYFSFVTDQYGHLENADALPAYYQARNNWDNNIPNWRFHGGERVVLAGKYQGLYVGIPTKINPDGQYWYEAFPFEIQKAKGLEVSASRPVQINIEKWNTGENRLGSGFLRPLSDVPGKTQLQWKIDNLAPKQAYNLFIDGQKAIETTADKYGSVLWTVTVPQKKGTLSFEVFRAGSSIEPVWKTDFDSVYPRSKTPAETVYVYDAFDYDADTKVFLTTLQGIVNKDKPRLYLILGKPGDTAAPKEDLETKHDLRWLYWLDENDYLKNVQKIDSIEQVIEMFDIREVILADCDVPASLNVGTTLAGIKGMPLAYAEHVEKYNLTVAESLKGRWTSNADAYKWIFENYWPKMNHTVIAFLAPDGNLSQLRDYIVSKNIFTFWISGDVDGASHYADSDKEEELMRDILSKVPVNIPVLGYPWAGHGVGIGELQGVALLSEYAKFLVPTDWKANLSVWTGIEAKNETFRQLPPRQVELDKNKIYATFLLSDGDNLNTWYDYFPMYWESEYRGQIPIAWTIGPSLIDLQAPLLDYYYDTLKPTDSFGAAVSGLGYVYPQNYAVAFGENRQDVWQQYLDLTRQYMEKLDINWAWLWRFGPTDGPLLRDFRNSIDELQIVFAGYGSRTPYDRANYFTQGMPVLYGVKGLAEHSDNPADASGLLKQVPEQKPAFMHIFLHNWTYKYRHIAELKANLGDDFVFVRPDELAALYKQYQSF